MCFLWNTSNYFCLILPIPSSFPFHLWSTKKQIHFNLIQFVNIQNENIICHGGRKVTYRLFLLSLPSMYRCERNLAKNKRKRFSLLLISVTKGKNTYMNVTSHIYPSYEHINKFHFLILLQYPGTPELLLLLLLP